MGTTFFYNVSFYFLGIYFAALGDVLSVLVVFGFSLFVVRKKVLVLVLFFVLGFFHFSFVESSKYECIDDYLGDDFGTESMISEVDLRREKQKVKIYFDECDVSILVNTSKYPVFERGDVVFVSGVLEKPEKIEDFDYDKYLLLSGTEGVINNGRVELVKISNSYDYIAEGRDLVEEKINRLYSEPEGSFLAGLLVGSRKGIHPDLMENFNITGLTHIIAISGYNISLLILLVNVVLKFISRKWRVFLTLLLIVFFVLFVGASAAVVRAGIMGGISLLAVWYGKQYDVLRALMMAGLLMVVFNPYTLIYDVGFQLSFLATLGVVVFGNGFMDKLSMLPDNLGFREAIAITLAAQVFVLPVIILNFGRISLISPLANFLVGPLSTFAMFSGAVSIILEIFKYPTWLFLRISVWFTNILASVPGASLDVEVGVEFSLIYYFLVGYYLFKSHKSKLEKAS